jgi:hypothetical protein
LSKQFATGDEEVREVELRTLIGSIRAAGVGCHLTSLHLICGILRYDGYSRSLLFTFAATVYSWNKELWHIITDETMRAYWDAK